MTRRPTLALLIPAYNASNFLPRLLASAVAQTEPFDEIWVYDDCSTDDTVAVAEQLGASVVRGDINRGCSHGKNTLVQRTNCDWVHFHDADDLLLPNFVWLARRWMASSAFDVVAFGCEERDAESGEVISVSKPDHQALNSDPVGATIRCKINSISGIYRREAFIRAGGYDLDPLVLYNEDEAMHASLARAGIRFGADPTVTVVNFRRANSMWTANMSRCIAARYHVLLKTFHSGVSPTQRQALAQELWGVAGVAASCLNWETADAAAALAMQLAGPSGASATSIFKALCRISPWLALRAREASIRMFRPATRTGCPAWGPRRAGAAERS